MNILLQIAKIMAIPILLLNTFGGIVSGIWLIVIGKWQLVLIGIILLFVSHLILSLLLLPSLLLAPITAKMYEKNNPIRFLFGFLSQLYPNLLIIATCIFAFGICMHFYHGDGRIQIVPFLLWSWGMALGPWQYFQSKEKDNEFSAITTLCLSICYLLFLVGVLIGNPITFIAATLFVVVQLIALPIFQLIIMEKIKTEPF